MPLPTLPSKLGAILSADEIKAAPKATPPAQVITPQTTSPVVTNVSQATFESASNAKKLSINASEI